MYLVICFYLFLPFTWIFQVQASRKLTRKGNVTDYVNTEMGLTTFPADIPKDAAWVSVRKNDITVIEAFPDLPFLVSLSLKENKIDRFPNLTIVASTLQSLTLGCNRLTWIDAELLNILGNLVALWMADNQLHVVPSMTGLTKLRHLGLSGNLLTTLPDLTGLESLNRLFLDNNQINETKDEDFSPVPQLSSLRFGGNPIKKFPNLTAVSNLRNLSLESTEITEVLDLSRLSKLVFLNLDHAPMIRFPNVTLSGKTLIILKLSYTGISRVPIELIQPLEVLQKLYLSFTDIKEFPELGCLGSTLKRLTLDGNQLTMIPLARVLELPALVYLNLKNNSIKSFKDICFIPHSLKIDLSSNPFYCDCHLKMLKIASWTRNFMEAASIRNLKQVNCAGPARLVGQVLDNVSYENLKCDDFQSADIQSGTISRYFSRKNRNFYCAGATTVEKTDTGSKLACARVCLSTPDCLSFNYIRDRGECSVYIMTFEHTGSLLSLPYGYT